ncbi:hypothetical protein HO133_009240 [Letharia lupina]|uniref:Uncharacterized protein n=1 Tax=Letharia lupina TaxID=560253 RepID=A0A8H6CNA3_9LECA|nr:uncharacterized protein HO133_009240 [Letharia lupina]KAF6226374.1 hypothetical protein HO133_009240 [Letharia lupina]
MSIRPKDPPTRNAKKPFSRAVIPHIPLCSHIKGRSKRYESFYEVSGLFLQDPQEPGTSTSSGSPKTAIPLHLLKDGQSGERVAINKAASIKSAGRVAINKAASIKSAGRSTISKSPSVHSAADSQRRESALPPKKYEDVESVYDENERDDSGRPTGKRLKDAPRPGGITVRWVEEESLREWYA